MFKFIKKRFSWILLIGFFVMVIIVSLFSGNKDNDYVEEYLFDFSHNKISELELKHYVIDNVSGNLEQKSIEIKKINNNWIIDDKTIDDDILERINKSITSIKFSKEIQNYKENDLIKWRINNPNYILNINLNNNLIRIIIGTDIERIGFYYISIDNNVYLIKEEYINSIISSINNLL